MQTYETLVPGAAVPRSARFLDNMEDKDGNQLYRVVVLSAKLDDYITKAKAENLLVKKFVYDFEKYKIEQENKTKLE